jgi:hypothetical protein
MPKAGAGGVPTYALGESFPILLMQVHSTCSKGLCFLSLSNRKGNKVYITNVYNEKGLRDSTTLPSSRILSIASLRT